MEQLVGCELQQMRAAAAAPAAAAGGGAVKGAKHAVSCSAGTTFNFLQVRRNTEQPWC
jgi:hypothetical protein